jgi:hypothetical protein
MGFWRPRSRADAAARAEGPRQASALALTYGASEDCAENRRQTASWSARGDAKGVLREARDCAHRPTVGTPRGRPEAPVRVHEDSRKSRVAGNPRAQPLVVQPLRIVVDNPAALYARQRQRHARPRYRHLRPDRRCPGPPRLANRQPLLADYRPPVPLGHVRRRRRHLQPHLAELRDRRRAARPPVWRRDRLRRLVHRLPELLRRAVQGPSVLALRPQPDDVPRSRTRHDPCVGG